MIEPNTYPRGTVEYVLAAVTADVVLDQTVAIAFGDIDPATGTWLAANWDGVETTSVDAETGLTLHHRVCRTDAPVAFTAVAFPLLEQYYEVGVKVTDTPEIPVMSAGWIMIT